MAKPNYVCEFTAELFRYPGAGGWVFAVVDEEHAPSSTLGWGRVPVRAEVDGKAWNTSIWREKSGRTLLAVPRKIRGEKDHADTVRVRIEYSIEYR
jgi:hypothetical protein